MYCHSCGIPTSQQMKYCNRCGAALVKAPDSTELKHPQKRLDSYLEGLFWVTVIGLAIIFGGLAVLKKVGLPEWAWITYLCLSSTAFVINVGINLWGALKMMRSPHEFAPASESEPALLVAPTNAQLPPASIPASVTENTTRSFEPVVHKRT